MSASAQGLRGWALGVAKACRTWEAQLGADLGPEDAAKLRTLLDAAKALQGPVSSPSGRVPANVGESIARLRGEAPKAAPSDASAYEQFAGAYTSLRALRASLDETLAAAPRAVWQSQRGLATVSRLFALGHDYLTHTTALHTASTSEPP